MMGREFDRPVEFSNPTYNGRRATDPHAKVPSIVFPAQQRTITDADIRAIQEAHSCPFQNVNPEHMREFEALWPTIKIMASATQRTGDKVVSIGIWVTAGGFFLILVGTIIYSASQLYQKFHNMLVKMGV